MAIQPEIEARRTIPEFLANYLDRAVDDIKAEPSPSPNADLLVRLGPGGPTLLLEVIASGRVPAVRQAARQVQQAAAEMDAVPVVVAPFMGEAGRRAAQEEGVWYLDLSGNAHLRADNFFVRVEGRPNAFPEPGRPSSPFAPRGARISRQLLLEPSRWWKQADLARATRLRSGQVSKVISRLAADELIEIRDDRALRPRDANELLDAWAEDYSYDRHHIVPGHVTGSGIELARNLGHELDSQAVRHAFTGLPAAWALDGFAQFRLVSVYVDADPIEVADAIGMRRLERGTNVHLVGPNDEGVLDGKQRAGGLTCVSAVQVYLDLLGLPERAAEAADHLRGDVLQFLSR